MITQELNPQSDYYLSLADAVKLLIELEGVPEDKIPTPAKLQTLLRRIAAKIKSFLKFEPLPSIYVEQTVTSEDGLITFSHYPVLRVLEVVHRYGAQPPEPFRLLKPYSLWAGDTRYYVGAYLAAIEVRYEAGFDPMPPEFIDAVLSILRDAIMEHGGRLDFLDTPTRDVTSLSVPGGLSQSFQLGKTKDGEGTQLERYLADVAVYQRKFEF